MKSFFAVLRGLQQIQDFGQEFNLIDNLSAGKKLKDFPTKFKLKVNLILIKSYETIRKCYKII